MELFSQGMCVYDFNYVCQELEETVVSVEHCSSKRDQTLYL